MHLSQPASIERLVVASSGFDLPAFAKMTTLKIWAEEGPPKETLYHYPNPYNHQTLSIAGGALSPQDRSADLHAGPDDKDDGALSPG